MPGLFDAFGVAVRLYQHREALTALWGRSQPVLALLRKDGPGLLQDGERLSREIFPELVPIYTVRWIQESLNQVGNYGLTADDDYGPATHAAVRDFQRRHGLDVDGWAGASTCAVLDSLARGG